MAREIDGLSFTYNVEEPLTPTATAETTEASSDDEAELSVSTPGFGVTATLVALLGALFVFSRR